MKSSHCDDSYLFQISSYDISRLLPQVSKALKKKVRISFPAALSQHVAAH